VAESLRLPPGQERSEPCLAIPKSVDYTRGNVCCLRTELRHRRSSGPLNACTGPGTDWRSRLNMLKHSQPHRELQNSLRAWDRIRTASILRRAISKDRRSIGRLHPLRHNRRECAQWNRARGSVEPPSRAMDLYLSGSKRAFIVELPVEDVEALRDLKVHGRQTRSVR
jgi:hypothetical protein